MSADGMGLWAAFIDNYAGDPQRTFNGMQNALHSIGKVLDEEDWQMAYYLTNNLYPDCKVIQESNFFPDIDEALKRLTDDSQDERRLLNIIYVMDVLDHRGLAEDFCAWAKANH